MGGDIISELGGGFLRNQHWKVRDLAKATGLHRNTITNIEVGRYAGNRDSIALMENPFRKAGVEFLPR